ncbi:FixH family protein [Flavobacteriaceae bacterium D16]|nr:FixH family protein [Flavobacteriaceae bacterium D16]
MKISWGTGIVLAFVAFIIFILYFVVLASTKNQANHDLVTREYYKEELAYQQEIDAQQNALPYAKATTFKKTGEGLLISFPDDFKFDNTQGKVSLYRPSNKHLDFDLPVSLSNKHLLIPDKQLLDGRWDIRIYWSDNDQNYLIKESINY